MKPTIIQKALKFYGEHGIEGFSMGPLAAHCNMGVANIYHHFGNRSGLLNAMYTYCWKNWETYLGKTDFSDAKGFKSKFKLFWDQSIIYFNKNTPQAVFMQLCELENLIDASSKKEAKAYQNHLNAIIQKGLEKNSIHNDSNPEWIKQFIIQNLLMVPNTEQSEHYFAMVLKAIRNKK